MNSPSTSPAKPGKADSLMGLPSPFAADVAFVIASREQSGARQIHPEEEALLSPRAVEKRREEFRLGRVAAHMALEKLGLDPAPAILKGPSREPLWPAGVIGTITHSGDLAIAAVARSERYLGIGLDIELDRNKKSFPLEQICGPEESAWVGSSDGWIERATAVFSAKESLFKALFPLCNRYIGFKEVACRWHPESNAFHAEILNEISPQVPRGAILSVGCVTLERPRAVLTHLIIPAPAL